MLNIALLSLVMFAVPATDPPEAMPANPVFEELLEKGIAMSDGKSYKLPPPSMRDGLKEAEQKAVIEKLAKQKNCSYEELIDERTAAPVVIAIRPLKESGDQSSAIREIDVFFVAHGKWEVLNSKEFLDSLSKTKKGENKNEVVSKSGFLTEAEMKKRGLELDSTPEREMKFIYATFSLFDQAEVSATRLAVATRSKTSLLGAAKMDPRFLEDAEYPNRWRPILRDAGGDITYGKPQPYSGGGAYAKITKLYEPPEGIFVECHLIYEEPYGWFEGGEMLNSKLPTVVKSKVRSFRSKLGVAEQKSEQKKTDR
jgi:hypothetical protein